MLIYHFLLPLVTIREVGGVSELQDHVIRVAVVELEQANLLGGDMLGWGRPVVMRRHLTRRDLRRCV